MDAWEHERKYCPNCLTYHARDSRCPQPAAQVLPPFQGTDDDYQIATRGQHLGGQLDDAGDGTTIVRWGMNEYRVWWSMGVPIKVEAFGTFSWADWD